MRGLLLIAVAIVLSTSPVVAEVPPEIVAPYLHIQLALANDSIDGVMEAAQSIATEAGQLGDEGKAVVIAAQVVVGTNDLTSARVAFGPLSDVLIEYAKEAGLGELQVAYCPMAKKSWVQKGGKILNPFYGSTMLNCGAFTQ